MEAIIKSYLGSKRSAVREDMPKGKFSPGFTRTTMLTAGEKIGLVFALHVTLGTERGALLCSKVIARIQEKYELKKWEIECLPQRGESHFFADVRTSNKQGGTAILRTIAGIRDLVNEMRRHNLSFIVEGKIFDELQAEYLIQTIHATLAVTPNKVFPHTTVPNLYSVNANQLTTTGERKAVQHISRVIRKTEGQVRRGGGRRKSRTSRTN